MSLVEMGSKNTDYDAAQALLDLHGNLKQENSETSTWHGNERRDDLEKAAKLFWNRFISSDRPISATPNKNLIGSSSKVLEGDNNNIITPARISPEQYKGFYNIIDPKTSERVDEPNFMAPSQRLTHFTRQSDNSFKHIKNLRPKSDVFTRDVGTQTEERYFNPNIEIMETTINNLCERIKALEAQLKEPSPSAQQSGFASSDNETNNYDNENITDRSHDNDFDMSNEEEINEHNTKRYSEESLNQYENINQNHRRILNNKKNNKHHSRVLINRNGYINCNDLVPIGDGHASVPSRILKHINWNSYTSATRKLLTAVFTRRILATHSLTGKRSPAFPNKPAKKKLDPALVNDIVQTVVERCSVPENVVRTSITTKCADESKMFRTRQRNGKKRSNKKDRENIPPITDSESDNY